MILKKKHDIRFFFKLSVTEQTVLWIYLEGKKKLGTNCNICNKTDDIINNQEKIFKINRRSFRCYIYTKNRQIQNTIRASQGNFMLIWNVCVIFEQLYVTYIPIVARTKEYHESHKLNTNDTGITWILMVSPKLFTRKLLWSKNIYKMYHID